MPRYPEAVVTSNISSVAYTGFPFPDGVKTDSYDRTIRQVDDDTATRRMSACA